MFKRNHRNIKKIQNSKYDHQKEGSGEGGCSVENHMAQNDIL